MVARRASESELRLRPLRLVNTMRLTARSGDRALLQWRGNRMAVTGFCMKCKQAREISNPQPTTLKNGKPATTGTCPVCGTKIFKIGKAA